ncbi:MAG: alkaline phosphatase PhoX [Myxococcota bacterium]
MRRRAWLMGGMATVGVSVATFASLFRREPISSAALQIDPAGVIDLPPGFSYRILSQRGDLMSDGFRTPGMPDGMACFQDEQNRWVLMRNHELPPRAFPLAAFRSGEEPEQSFDRRSIGGVSRMVIDPRSGSVVSSNLVLTGTNRNCAGGPSPWGWLSCEEDTAPGHGYVFLCSTSADRLQRPRPIPAYGRFNHEAVAVESTRKIAYLTEDREDSSFYRFIPHTSDRPFEGRFQAMAVNGETKFDTGAFPQRASLPVRWVDVTGQDSEHDDLRHRAQELGAAVVHRGEGIWYLNGQVFFTATSGGPNALGQVFRLRLGDDDRAEDRLELIAQSEASEALDMPDNLTVSPYGDLVLAEDGHGHQFLRLLSMDGRLRPLARNAISRSEFAGVCFSPDGAALFANIQGDGLTLMIEGPFEEYRADEEHRAEPERQLSEKSV